MRQLGQVGNNKISLSYEFKDYDETEQTSSDFCKNVKICVWLSFINNAYT